MRKNLNPNVQLLEILLGNKLDTTNEEVKKEHITLPLSANSKDHRKEYPLSLHSVQGTC